MLSDKVCEDFLCVAGMAATTENVQHLRVMMEAMAIYDQRTRSYGQVWRQYGARANLLSVARKADRLMELWWHGREITHKDALDDAFDLINYAAFMIRNHREGNIDGTPPHRPIVMRVE